MVTRNSHSKNTTSEASFAANYESARDKAERHSRKGQWDAAIAQCRFALEHNSEDGQMHTLLGNALSELKSWPEAISSYEKALLIEPDNALLHCKIAIALAQADRPLEADNHYAQFLHQSPNAQGLAVDNFLAHRLAGDFFFRQNKPQEAIDAYQKASVLQPDDCWVHINLGRLLCDNEQERAGIEQFQKAINIDEENFLPYYHISNFWLTQERYEEAEETARKALHLESENSLIQDLLKQIEDKRAASKTPEPAHIEIEESRLEESPSADETQARTQKSASEESFQLYYSLGCQLLEQARWAEAVIAYKQALKINNRFYATYCDLGDAFSRLNRWSEAEQAYQKALELNPVLPCLVDKRNKAAIQRQARQPELIKHAANALLADPLNSTFYVSLADAFYQYSYLDEAIAHYRTAIDIASCDKDEINQKLAVVEAKKERIHSAFYASKATPANYAAWILDSAPDVETLSSMPERVSCFRYKPVISIVVPTYNPPEKVLREMIQSVFDQIYPYWELCIADDCSTEPHVRAVLEEYAALDDRIKVVFRDQNGHISAASNSALTVATGEYVSLLDHDDELSPDALYEVALLLNQHPEADMVYSDEDKRSLDGKRTDPYFKPDWSPDTFLSRMYTCHLSTFRKSILEEIGGFRLGLEGSQDYDLVLRFTEQTQNIFHIPKVLYHWRVIESSVTSGAEAKPYAYEAAVKALSEALERRGEPGQIEMSDKVAGIYIPRYQIQAYKLVSIIIPTRNLGHILKTCLESILEKTTYPNYEIVLLDNGSDEAETIKLIETWKQKEPNRFKHIVYDVPFNYSKINNYAVTQSSGDYLLFLNNDIEVISPGWLTAMVEQAQRSSIGAVGAKMYYEDDTLQHGGVVLGIGDAAGHSHRHAHRDDYGYVGQLLAVNNYSAVTAACLMCRREVFESVGGFDEALGVAFNDVELCIRIQNAGYRNIWLPHVELYHYESKSRGYEDTPEKMQRLQKEAKYVREKWGEIIENDPCYSPHLTKKKEDYGIRTVPFGEVLSVTQQPFQDKNILKSCIDFPKPGKCTAITDVSGWVISQASAIETVELLLDNVVISKTDELHNRSDVSAAYPNSRFSLQSGFRLHCNVIDLPRHASLVVQVTLKNGTSINIGEIDISNDRSDHTLQKAKRLDAADVAISQNPSHKTSQNSNGQNRAVGQLSSQVPAVLEKEHSVFIHSVLSHQNKRLIAKSYIDSPVAQTSVTEIPISGWVIGEQPVKAVGIFHGETLIEMVSVDQHRPDVARTYPGIVVSDCCGFSTRLAADTLDRNRSEICLKAFLPDECVEIGVITFQYK